MLFRGQATAFEHAILLCSLLRGSQLDAYVCVGEGISSVTLCGYLFLFFLLQRMVLRITGWFRLPRVRLLLVKRKLLLVRSPSVLFQMDLKLLCFFVSCWYKITNLSWLDSAEATTAKSTFAFYLYNIDTNCFL